MKKHLMLCVIGFGALVVLSGCDTIKALTASGPTSAPVANSLQTAGNFMHAAAPVVQAYVKTANCPQPCRDQIASINHEIRQDMDSGFDAELSGNNAAMAVALQEFNTHYGSLWQFMANGGSPLPSS